MRTMQGTLIQIVARSRILLSGNCCKVISQCQDGLERKGGLYQRTVGTLKPVVERFRDRAQRLTRVAQALAAGI